MGNASSRGIGILYPKKITSINNCKVDIIQRGSNSTIPRNPANGHVYLLIDCSGSMTGDKIGQAKRGAIDFSKGAQNKGYAIGLISFSDHARHLMEPRPDYRELIPRVNNLGIYGSTNMTEGILAAMNGLKGLPGFKAMVIVTDGMPNDPDGTLSMAKEAKNSGIEIMAIGTDDADQNFLKILASRRDMGVKVAMENFELAISSTALMLPSANNGPR